MGGACGGCPRGACGGCQRVGVKEVFASSTSMHFPLHSNAVNNHSGLEVGGNCNVEIFDGVIKFCGCITAMEFVLLVPPPVLLLLKNSIPGDECILA